MSFYKLLFELFQNKNFFLLYSNSYQVWDPPVNARFSANIGLCIVTLVLENRLTLFSGFLKVYRNVCSHRMCLSAYECGWVLPQFLDQLLGMPRFSWAFTCGWALCNIFYFYILSSVCESIFLWQKKLVRIYGKTFSLHQHPHIRFKNHITARWNFVL